MKKYLKRTVFIIVIFAIVIIEISLRLFYKQELSIRDDRDSIFLEDSVLFYIYRPNKNFIVGGITHQINSHGYIGHEILPKSPDTFRIAIVGACGVAGSVHQPSYFSFCPMLQQHFKDNGLKVEVLNCGIDGQGRSLTLYRSIEYKVLQFEPDMILLEYDLPFYTDNATREDYRGYKLTYPKTDPDALVREKKMVDNLYKYEKWITFFCNSYIIRATARFYMFRAHNHFSYHIVLYHGKGISLGDWKGVTFSMEESAKKMNSLKDKLASRGIQFFLFQYTKDTSRIQTAKEYQLPLISLNTNFEENDFFYKDDHWNENGCQKIADRFFELIIKYQLIHE